MAFVRKHRDRDGNLTYSVVKSVRRGHKVVQRRICYLGTYPSIEAALKGLPAELAVQETLAAEAHDDATEAERVFRRRFGKTWHNWHRRYVYTENLPELAGTIPPRWVLSEGTHPTHQQNNPGFAQAQSLIRVHWDAVKEQARAEAAAATIGERLESVRAAEAALGGKELGHG